MIDELLLIRYLSGDCSSEESQRVEGWIVSGKTNADRFFELERIWNLKEELHFSDKKEIETEYNRLMNRIEAMAKPQKKQKIERSFRLSFLSRWAAYAAAVVLLGFLSYNFFFLDGHKEVALNILEVPRGQQASLTLSDGTKVWINSGSKLTYPSDFSPTFRKVRLEGEAYFEVSHNEQYPFIVESPLIDVKVLGTTFNVRAYDEEETSVILSQGKVEVSRAVTPSKDENSSEEAASEKIILKPRQQIHYSTKKGFALTDNVDVSNLKNWVTGQFFFRDQPLSEIAKELERRFDVRILIQDTVLAGEVFTCHTRSGASLDQILEILKETRRMNYVKKEKTIRILTPQNKLPMGK